MTENPKSEILNKFQILMSQNSKQKEGLENGDVNIRYCSGFRY